MEIQNLPPTTSIFQEMSSVFQSSVTPMVDGSSVSSGESLLEQLKTTVSHPEWE